MLAALGDLIGREGSADAVPAVVRQYLDGALNVARRRIEALRWEVECLRCELPELLATRPILLKGVAYIACDLPHARARLCADIDVLFPRAELDRVERMLEWAGWTTGEIDPYDERYYRDWMHQLPPLQHRRRGSTLDLHHNILPETARRPPDGRRLVAQAVTLPDDATFAVLAPAHMAIHSAVHLFADSEWEKATRDFYDLDQLLRYFGRGESPAFWKALLEEADVLGRGREVFYALRYCRRWFITPMPDEVLESSARWRPPQPVLAVMDWVFHHATAARASGPHPRRTALCRGFLFVRSHWLKMPPLLLVRHLFHKAFLSPRDDSA